MADIKDLIKIQGLPALAAELKRLSIEKGSAVLPGFDPHFRLELEVKSDPNYIMFSDGRPVNYDKFLKDNLEVLGANTPPQRRGLVIKELEAVRRNDPDMYQLWKTDVNWGSDVPIPGKTTTKWKGSNAVTVEINRQLELLAREEDSSSNVLIINRFEESLARASNTTIYRSLDRSINQIKSNLNDSWTRLCNSYISDYLNSPSASSAIVGGFTGGSGKYLTLHGKDNKGISYTLYGKLYHVNTDMVSNTRTEWPGVTPIIEVDKMGPIAPIRTKPSSITKVEIEHGVEGNSQGGYAYYVGLHALRDIYANNSPVDDNDRMMIKAIDYTIQVMQPAIDETKISDRTVIDPSAMALKTLDDGNGATVDKLTDSLAKAASINTGLGLDEMNIFTSAGSVVVLGGTVKLPVIIDFSTFFVGDKGQNRYKGAAKSIARGNVFKKEVAPRLIYSIGPTFFFQQGSSSLLEHAILLAIQEVLSPLDPSNSVKKLIKPRQPKSKKLAVSFKAKRQTIKVDNAKALAIAKLVDNRVKNNIKQIKSVIQSSATKQKRRRSRVTGRIIIGDTDSHSNNHLSIVNFINSNIRMAIIQEMRQPSLVNRTGRFASSVKVTSPTEKAINYSYRRDPYAVFSRKIGVGPWNRVPARDPHIIIKKAIHRVVSDRLKGVTLDVKESD